MSAINIDIKKTPNIEEKIKNEIKEILKFSATRMILGAVILKSEEDYFSFGFRGFVFKEKKDIENFVKEAISYFRTKIVDL